MAGSNGSETHDLRTLFSGDGGDHLVRSTGDQVKVGDLEGKTVGVYFSAEAYAEFSHELAEAYAELSPKGFEVVFVSSDGDEDSFQRHFSDMPWLAVPFPSSATRQRLKELFKVTDIPRLVVLDGSNGRVLTHKAVGVVMEHGAEGYPFTPERLAELEEAAKRNQTLYSVLGSPSRDFVFNSDGDKVPIADLEGKIVCLYFSLPSYPPCVDFTPLLEKMYQELKKNRGEPFEVVLASLEDKELAFEEDFERMPWLAIPFKDKSLERLPRYFELRDLPRLVVIGHNGKTLCADAAELVQEHGAGAYPFSSEKLAELAEVERAKREAQTLESLLVSGELDYVVAKDGVKVPVSELVGKNILLYFSAHRPGPTFPDFTPRLIQVYQEIKAKDSAFEVIFISGDFKQSTYDEYFSGMPWLALPFRDARMLSLIRKYKIDSIPCLVAIGPSGRTVATEAREMIRNYGADAYPFTEERLKQLEQEMEEMAKGWPEKVKHHLHEEHELLLTRRRVYGCDGCEDEGRGWSFCCEKCDFDLHPKCALMAVDEKEAAEGRQL